jgi:CRP-like cAMP-binding protein
MKQKTISLSREAVLWEAGDAAREIAVVECGRLAVRTEAGVVGIVLPKMVVGETALLTLEGQRLPRAATLFALEDDTQVVARPAESYRASFEAGDTAIVDPILRTLVGQTCRNLLMVVSARSGDPFVDEPLLGLVRGIAQDVARPLPARTWAAFISTFSLLCDLRDMSDRLLGRLGPEPALRLELVESASQALARLAGSDDARPMIEAFLDAERERTHWWARG